MRATKLFALTIFSLIILALGAAPVLAEDFIGSVTTLTGKGFVVRAGKLKPIDVGGHIMVDDTLVTVKNSTMGVIFRDDTQLSLGPETEIKIDKFVFDPMHDNMDFLAKMRTGTAAFLTGKLAQLAPEKMVVQTPLSTIGIRGTRFLVKINQEEK